MKIYLWKTVFAFSMGLMTISCSDFLDKEPLSYIVPEDYYRTEDQVQACANKFYEILPSNARGSNDTDTDTQIGTGANSKYAKGQWKVGSTNGSWSWTNIRNVNYQLRSIMDRYDAGEISGSDKNIRQYIGEIYFS